MLAEHRGMLATDLLDTMPPDATPTPAPSPPTRTHHEGASPELGAGYLLCIEDGSSHTVPLPGDGELAIGRDPECAIRLVDAQVSRRHAVITAVGDGVRVTDLESRHGTFVNGERVTRPRRLLSGDVITLGGAVLVVHRSARAIGVRTVVDAAELSTRLEIELDRTLRYGRAVAVVVVRGDADVDRVGDADADAGHDDQPLGAPLVVREERLVGQARGDAYDRGRQHEHAEAEPDPPGQRPAQRRRQGHAEQPAARLRHRAAALADPQVRHPAEQAGGQRLVPRGQPRRVHPRRGHVVDVGDAGAGVRAVAAAEAEQLDRAGRGRRGPGAQCDHRQRGRASHRPRISSSRGASPARTPSRPPGAGPRW